MPLIDTTYFDSGLTFIAQLDLIYNRNRVNGFINKYEPEYLNKVLGRKLSAAFAAGLNVDPIEERWLRLRDGADFEYRGIMKRWDGFINDLKVSPIAMYVYYWHMRKQASPNTGSGNVLPVVENGTRTSYVRDGVLVWGEMLERNITLLEFLLTNANDYPEWEVRLWRSRIWGYDRYDYNYGLLRRHCSFVDWDLFSPLNHLNL